MEIEKLNTVDQALLRKAANDNPSVLPMLFKSLEISYSNYVPKIDFSNIRRELFGNDNKKNNQFYGDQFPKENMKKGKPENRPHLDEVISSLGNRPKETIENFYFFLDSIDKIVAAGKKDLELSKEEIYQALGLTERQYYYRLSNPKIWEKDELIKLIKLFKL